MQEMEAEEVAVFRARKRRKAALPVADQEHDDDDHLQRPVPRVDRKRGIGFASGATTEERNEEKALVVAEPVATETKSPPTTTPGRFVRPGTQAVQVEDKHLVAYVEDRISQLRREASSQRQEEEQAALDERDGIEQETIRQADGAVEPGQKNKAPTEPKPPRARRQKPLRWRRRAPPPPTEDKLARDALVEEMLSTPQVDGIYSKSTAPTTTAQPGQNEDADFLAEQEFRQRFFSDLEARRAKRQAAQSATTSANETKGPKLGGSRNQRAAMRIAEEKAGTLKP